MKDRIIEYWGCLGTVLLMLMCGCIGACVHKKMQPEITADTVVVVKTDTHFVDRPVAKDSTIVKYITRVVKVADVNSGETTVSETYMGEDTSRQEVVVELPIEQKHYVDSTYEAWVSGYEPALDSIRVFNKTIEKTITLTMQKKPRRFGVGVQVGAGYGLINQKPDVYVGVGGYFRLF